MLWDESRDKDVSVISLRVFGWWMDMGEDEMGDGRWQVLWVMADAWPGCDAEAKQRKLPTSDEVVPISARQTH
jgi:alpha-glucosidase (family GH31 glycosyl hydrolase)